MPQFVGVTGQGDAVFSEQLIRFCTALCESPEAAIEAAPQMVQP